MNFLKKFRIFFDFIFDLIGFFYLDLFEFLNFKFLLCAVVATNAAAE